MNAVCRRITSGTISLLILLSVLTTGVFAAPAAYSKTANSGTRHEICTTLDGTSADEYYTGDYAYSNLSTQAPDVLLQSLRDLMTETHTTITTYANCRDYAPKTDCQNGDDSIVLLYTSFVTDMSGYINNSGIWNREHVWPKSLGGFDEDGAGADLHHIRPDDKSTNSQRGNKKFGNVENGKEVLATPGANNTLGGHSSGSYFEPLDDVKGDVARICLYVYVRYGGSYPKCANITNVFESVDVLLEWMELDPVDTWEAGRNEVVGAIQGNRNVFIDHPEYAWLLFGREIPENLVTPCGMSHAAESPTIPTESSVPTAPTTSSESSVPTQAPEAPSTLKYLLFPIVGVVAAVTVILIKKRKT